MHSGPSAYTCRILDNSLSDGNCSLYTSGMGQRTSLIPGLPHHSSLPLSASFPVDYDLDSFVDFPTSSSHSHGQVVCRTYCSLQSGRVGRGTSSIIDSSCIKGRNNLRDEVWQCCIDPPRGVDDVLPKVGAVGCDTPNDVLVEGKTMVGDGRGGITILSATV
ncbi:hypothetical protein Tco_0040639 [Tanacetum coccineum]